MSTFDPNDESYLDHLSEIAEEDAAGLKQAQHHYGNSWKSRGGVGAFMMLARKWDRLENRVSETLLHPMSDHSTVEEAAPAVRCSAWDIFGHIAADPRPEGIIDDVRDLRRYLMLVEAEMRVQQSYAAVSRHRDNAEEPK